MSHSRFELLCQKHLDDEATEAERAELTETIARDPAARRRFDEYVALEGLLFAVANTERPDEEPREAAPPLDLFDASRDAIPSEEEAALSGAWISSLAGALLLAVIVWSGLPDPSTPKPTQTVEETKPPLRRLEVAALSPGLHAVVQETEDPSIQFIWIGGKNLPPDREAEILNPDPTPRKDTDE